MKGVFIIETWYQARNQAGALLPSHVVTACGSAASRSKAAARSARV
jgi:hypothetical protein